MTMPHRHLAGAVTAVVVATLAGACTAGRSPEPTGPTPAPAPAADAAALTAYAEFWRVTGEALAAPASRNWTPELGRVATGPALEAVLGDVANYASLPAHTVGTVHRDPRVDEVGAARVSILDCVDLGDSRLVSDSTGQPLDDLANRTVRYRYRADVVRTDGGGWLVERTTPALDEPC
jgi:hypothetical protein